MTEAMAPHRTTRTLPPLPANGSSRSPPAPQATERPPLQTRIRVMRTTLIAGLAALIVAVIFVIQNVHAANISFLGVHLLLPLAGALLGAAITGSLLTIAAGPARITRLQEIMRRGWHSARTGSGALDERSLSGPERSADGAPEVPAPSSLEIARATPDHRLPAHVTD